MEIFYCIVTPNTTQHESKKMETEDKKRYCL